jgi:hypothetical protein
MMTNYGRLLDLVGQLGLVLLCLAVLAGGFVALVLLVRGGRRGPPAESGTTTEPPGGVCDRACPGSPAARRRGPPEV